MTAVWVGFALCLLRAAAQEDVVGTLSLVAGVPQTSGDNVDYATPVGAAQALFSTPSGIVADGSGTIYVSEKDTLRSIQGGVVRIVAGQKDAVGDATGLGSNSLFRSPQALGYYNGSVYICDTGNKKVRRFNGTHVSDFANVTGVPKGIVFSTAGDAYFIDDSNALTRMSTSGSRTVMATVTGPTAIAMDPMGEFVAVAHSQTISVFFIGNSSLATVVASLPSDPAGLAFDDDGNIMMALGNSVRIVYRHTYTVRTLLSPAFGYANGDFSTANFSGVKTVFFVGIARTAPFEYVFTEAAVNYVVRRISIFRKTQIADWWVTPSVTMVPTSNATVMVAVRAAAVADLTALLQYANNVTSGGSETLSGTLTSFLFRVPAFLINDTSRAAAAASSWPALSAVVAAHNAPRSIAISFPATGLPNLNASVMGTVLAAFAADITPVYGSNVTVNTTNFSFDGQVAVFFATIPGAFQNASSQARLVNTTFASTVAAITAAAATQSIFIHFTPASSFPTSNATVMAAITAAFSSDIAAVTKMNMSIGSPPFAVIGSAIVFNASIPAAAYNATTNANLGAFAFPATAGALAAFHAVRTVRIAFAAADQPLRNATVMNSVIGEFSADLNQILRSSNFSVNYTFEVAGATVWLAALVPGAFYNDTTNAAFAASVWPRVTALISTTVPVAVTFSSADWPLANATKMQLVRAHLITDAKAYYNYTGQYLNLSAASPAINATAGTITWVFDAPFFLVPGTNLSASTFPSTTAYINGFELMSVSFDAFEWPFENATALSYAQSLMVADANTFYGFSGSVTAKVNTYSLSGGNITWSLSIPNIVNTTTNPMPAAAFTTTLAFLRRVEHTVPFDLGPWPTADTSKMAILRGLLVSDAQNFFNYTGGALTLNGTQPIIDAAASKIRWTFLLPAAVDRAANLSAYGFPLTMAYLFNTTTLAPTSSTTASSTTTASTTTASTTTAATPAPSPTSTDDGTGGRTGDRTLASEPSFGGSCNKGCIVGVAVVAAVIIAIAAIAIILCVSKRKRRSNVVAPNYNPTLNSKTIDIE